MTQVPSLTPQQRKEVMIKYLLLKAFEEDWHGVRDAAADLEKMVAVHPELRPAA